MTSTAAPTTDDCIEEANVEFSYNLAHHLDWLQKQRPMADIQWAMSVGLSLLNAAAQQGATFAITRNEDGSFAFTNSQ